ncbi:MAG: hypothetical protein JWP97_5333 [Labilithrix sp.]|nr:hypothetical protein [Labilithrix sp.]
MSRAPRILALAAALTSLALASGCRRVERYESAVQIVRKEEVEKAPDGTVTQVDYEVEWDACPGDQFQVIRGSQWFAKCTEKYEVGDEVPVYVRHWWDERGYYRWDIERLGDCWREIEPDSVGSYEKGQECKETTNHGVKTGFNCSRKPFSALVKRCPWMARD